MIIGSQIAFQIIGAVPSSVIELDSYFFYGFGTLRSSRTGGKVDLLHSLGMNLYLTATDRSRL